MYFYYGFLSPFRPYLNVFLWVKHCVCGDVDIWNMCVSCTIDLNNDRRHFIASKKSERVKKESIES